MILICLRIGRRVRLIIGASLEQDLDGAWLEQGRIAAWSAHGRGEAAAQLGQPDEDEAHAAFRVHGEVGQVQVLEDVVAWMRG